MQDVALASPEAQSALVGELEQLPWKAVLQPGPLPPQAVVLRGGVRPQGSREAARPLHGAG